MRVGAGGELAVFSAVLSLLVNTGMGRVGMDDGKLVMADMIGYKCLAMVPTLRVTASKTNTTHLTLATIAIQLHR